MGYFTTVNWQTCRYECELASGNVHSYWTWPICRWLPVKNVWFWVHVCCCEFCAGNLKCLEDVKFSASQVWDWTWNIMKPRKKNGLLYLGRWFALLEIAMKLPCFAFLFPVSGLYNPRLEVSNFVFVVTPNQILHHGLWLTWWCLRSLVLGYPISNLDSGPRYNPPKNVQSILSPTDLLRKLYCQLASTPPTLWRLAWTSLQDPWMRQFEMVRTFRTWICHRSNVE